MKKKIAILEFETHSNLLLQWNSLLIDSEVFDVDFFLSAKIHQQIKNEIFKVVVLEKKQIPSYDFSNFNLIIINTLHRDFNLFSAILKNYTTLLVIHNLNFYFKTNQPNFLKLIYLYDWKMKYYLLKLMLKEKVYKQKKKIFNSKFFGYLGNSANEIDNLYSIPIHFNQYHKIIKKDEILICIPGSVEQKRKDYFSVIELIKKIKPISALHFVFLGKVKDEKLKLQLKNLSSKNINNLKITYFKSRVEQEDFDKFMNASDFIFCPVHQKTDFYLQDENYGKTKISGAEFDCITYGKPALFPDFYSFDWNIIKYNQFKELEGFFNHLTFESIQEHQIKTEKFIQLYQKKQTQQKLEEFLKGLINQVE